MRGRYCRYFSSDGDERKRYDSDCVGAFPFLLNFLRHSHVEDRFSVLLESFAGLSRRSAGRAIMDGSVVMAKSSDGGADAVQSVLSCRYACSCFSSSACLSPSEVWCFMVQRSLHHVAE